VKDSIAVGVDFLLGHWHCIVPVLAIVIVLIVQNLGKNRKADQHSR
jgi:hypothetical protein